MKIIGRVSFVIVLAGPRLIFWQARLVQALGKPLGVKDTELGGKYCKYTGDCLLEWDHSMASRKIQRVILVTHLYDIQELRSEPIIPRKW